MAFIDKNGCAVLDAGERVLVERVERLLFRLSERGGQEDAGAKWAALDDARAAIHPTDEMKDDFILEKQHGDLFGFIDEPGGIFIQSHSPTPNAAGQASGVQRTHQVSVTGAYCSGGRYAIQAAASWHVRIVGGTRSMYW